MIIGTGIDIIELERIEQILKRQGKPFINRILTEDEQLRIPHLRNRRVEYVAGRFSAKESLAKAIGVGIGTHLSWHDILIMPNSLGKPEIMLSEKAQGLIPPHSRIHLTLSHSKYYCVSHVIIELV
ncbi:MAG: holo-ACP synthase [Bacilli bacterium]